MSEGWPDALFDALRGAGVTLVAHVPDVGHARLIARCRADAAVDCVGLTTEEEGIALAAGAWLGGMRAALLMQSSGIGNCVNMLSLATIGRFPLLLLATMRGEWGEANPWQVPMGRIAGDVLRLAGVSVHPVDTPERVAETVAAAATMAFEGETRNAVLIGQRVVGAKAFEREDGR